MRRYAMNAAHSPKGFPSDPNRTAFWNGLNEAIGAYNALDQESQQLREELEAFKLENTHLRRLVDDYEGLLPTKPDAQLDEISLDG